MGVNCEEDDLDKVTPYELSDDDLAVVTAADEPEHAKVMKGWTNAQ